MKLIRRFSFSILCLIVNWCMRFSEYAARGKTGGAQSTERSGVDVGGPGIAQRSRHGENLMHQLTASLKMGKTNAYAYFYPEAREMAENKAPTGS